MLTRVRAPWRGGTAAVVVALSTVVAGAVAAPAVAAAADPPVVWRSPVDPTIYALDDDGICHALQYADWVAIGAPAPRLFPAEYLAVPGFPYVYASVTVCGRVQEDLLSYARWTSVGSPAPRSTYQVQEIEFFHYVSTPAEVFVQAQGLSINPYTLYLTYAGWLAAGSPTPREVPSRYQRPSWSNRIVAFPTYPGSTLDNQPLRYEDRTFAGSPTPEVVGNLPDGRFVQYPGEPQLSYQYGSRSSFPATLDEWAAAGYPRPVPA